MPNITGVQWRDEQDASNYPFEDGLALTNDDGIVVPPGLLLDAVLYAPFSGARPRLSKIIITNETATLIFGDSVTEAVCQGVVSLAEPGDAVVLTDSYATECGVLVSSEIRLAGLQALPVGEHEFTAEQTALVPTVVVPSSSGVSSLILPSGQKLVGEVWLVGGQGVIIQQDESGNISINAVGDPLFKKALCDPGRYETPRFLKKLVVQKGPITHTFEPNSLGDIPITVGSNIVEDGVLRVEKSDSGLRWNIVGEKLRGVL